MTPPLFAGAFRACGPFAPLTAARLSGTASRALRPKASRRAGLRDELSPFEKNTACLVSELRAWAFPDFIFRKTYGFLALWPRDESLALAGNFSKIFSRIQNAGQAACSQPRSSRRKTGRFEERCPTRRLFPKTERTRMRRVGTRKGASLSAGGASGSELIASGRASSGFAGRACVAANERGKGGRGCSVGRQPQAAPAFPRLEDSPLKKEV